ncbi:phosphonate metabolism protein/1,5-bisphosphokinase (PRPP-forming) PhnN [Jannaschia sp. CCS1]|uniref:phosphonate metabolism protein/1,5-bisphosphokinase (PRPP-forming) PhnN n=1 Tax=Jannaschia sp. (strain CCS1) TaxID=290400 RepID=UPI000053B6B5|nr:phosphonate metabolism protein/1,5-bisphosphokinase (PRPP-forming) PhnN [Jannaschia sp. CCS1]ABD55772.1 Phosphonate metabolism 15-bisphosphokinase (PRPP-forming) PhnN [Jannaschia sp. CCS1]
MSSPEPTPKGRLIAVIGPSGAGKDSVMDGLCAARPELQSARRVITRASTAGGEAFDAVSEATFAMKAARGDFALHWQAHGLNYGIPTGVQEALDRGLDVLANLSRGALAEAEGVFENMVVLHITAPPDVLAQRVARRGREMGRDAAARLTRPAPALPDGLKVIEIDNSGSLADSIATALDALYPDRG